MSRKVTEDAGEIDALSMLTTPAGFPRTCNGELAKGAGGGEGGRQPDVYWPGLVSVRL